MSRAERERLYDADRAYLLREIRTLEETLRQTRTYQRDASHAVQTLQRMIHRSKRLYELILPPE